MILIQPHKKTPLTDTQQCLHDQDAALPSERCVEAGSVCLVWRTRVSYLPRVLLRCCFLGGVLSEAADTADEHAALALTLREREGRVHSQRTGFLEVTCFPGTVLARICSYCRIHPSERIRIFRVSRSIYCTVRNYREVFCFK